MDKAYSTGGGIAVLPCHEPAGPLGFLPMNAYVIKGIEPFRFPDDAGFGAMLEQMKAEAA
jgi:hypothetical protein